MPTQAELLKTLDERFVLGDIPPDAYQELRSRILSTDADGAGAPTATASRTGSADSTSSTSSPQAGSPLAGRQAEAGMSIRDSVIKGDVTNLNFHVAASDQLADRELNYERFVLVVLRAGATLTEARVDLEERRLELGLSLRQSKEIEKACLEAHREATPTRSTSAGQTPRAAIPLAVPPPIPVAAPSPFIVSRPPPAPPATRPGRAARFAASRQQAPVNASASERDPQAPAFDNDDKAATPEKPAGRGREVRKWVEDHKLLLAAIGSGAGAVLIIALLAMLVRPSAPPLVADSGDRSPGVPPGVSYRPTVVPSPAPVAPPQIADSSLPTPASSVPQVVLDPAVPSAVPSMSSPVPSVAAPPNAEHNLSRPDAHVPEPVAAPAPPPPSPLEQALVQATAKDVQEMRKGATSLGKLDIDPDSRDKVLAALKPHINDADADTRRLFVQAFARWATRDQVEDLCGIIDVPKKVEGISGQEASWAAATAALVRLDPDKAREALEKRIGAGFYRGECMHALEPLVNGDGPEKALAAQMTERLKNPNSIIWIKSLDDVQRLIANDRDAKQQKLGAAWLTQADVDPKQRQTVLTLLKPHLSEPMPDMRVAFFEAYAVWADRAQVPELVAMADSEQPAQGPGKHTWVVAVMALARLDPDAAGRAVDKHKDDFSFRVDCNRSLKQLAEGDMQQRAVAARLLDRLLQRR